MALAATKLGKNQSGNKGNSKDIQPKYTDIFFFSIMIFQLLKAVGVQ